MLTVAAYGLGTPRSAMGQVLSTEAEATRALRATALMASSATFYTEAVVRLATRGARLTGRDLAEEVSVFRGAIEMAKQGRARYGNTLSSASFHADTDAILADAVRSRTFDDPLVAALLAASEAAEVAVTIPRWDTESSREELVRLVADASVLESAKEFGRAAVSALRIAVERANDSRAKAEEADIRAAAGAIWGSVHGAVDRALARAEAAARFNAVWQSALGIARSSELDGTDYLALERKLMWEVYVAAQAWHGTVR